MSDIDLSKIKALAWDVGGTVFDWHHSIKDELDRIAAERGAELDTFQFTNDWRYGMFRNLRKRLEEPPPWPNADAFHRKTLDEVIAKHGGPELSAAERDDLNEVWHHMRAWPDAREAIERMRGRYAVTVLTVMSWSIAVDCSKFNGISWDAILSCEILPQYKPHADSYQTAARLLRLEPDEVLMVAAHAADLDGAAAAGLRTAYVPRPGEGGIEGEPNLDPIERFDVNARDFPDLADQLLA